MEKSKNYYDHNKTNKQKSYKDNKFDQHRNYLQLPSAASLAEYEELSEGAADKIVEMIEAEQIQRHEIENFRVRTDNRYRYCALLIEFLTIITIIITALSLSSHDSKISFAIVTWGFSIILFGKILSFLKNIYSRRRFNRYKRNKEKH